MPILETLTLEELKFVYNHHLARYKKAEKYFEKHKESIEKWQSEFDTVINIMGYTVEELQKRGINITSKDILDGFEK